jgi:hypothetical protein
MNFSFLRRNVASPGALVAIPCNAAAQDRPDRSTILGSFRGFGAFGPILIGALAFTSLIALAPAADAADTCPAACEASCSTCCKTWTLRAACVSGQPRPGEGTFASYGEAKVAADRANERALACVGQADACKERVKCGASWELAEWEPACAASERIINPDAGKELDALGAAVGAVLPGVEDARAKLGAFTADSKLTKRAETSAKALRSELGQLATQLAAARDRVKVELDAQAMTGAEARKLAATYARALKTAPASVTATASLIQDPISLEAKPITAPLPTAPSPKTPAIVTPPVVTPPVIQPVDTVALDAIDKAVDEALARAGRARGTLTSVLQQPKLSGKAKLSVGLFTRNLADLESKLKVSLERVKVARGAAADATRLALLRKDTLALTEAVGRTDDEVKKLAAALPAPPLDPGAPGRPVDAVAPARPSATASPSLRTCEVSFEIDGASGKAMLELDGTRTVALPAKVTIVSGRHSLKVNGISRGTDQLLLCGHVTRVGVLAK